MPGFQKPNRHSPAASVSCSRPFSSTCVISACRSPSSSSPSAAVKHFSSCAATSFFSSYCVSRMLESTLFRRVPSFGDGDD